HVGHLYRPRAELVVDPRAHGGPLTVDGANVRGADHPVRVLPSVGQYVENLLGFRGDEPPYFHHRFPPSSACPCGRAVATTIVVSPTRVAAAHRDTAWWGTTPRLRLTHMKRQACGPAAHVLRSPGRRASGRERRRPMLAGTATPFTGRIAGSGRRSEMDEDAAGVLRIDLRRPVEVFHVLRAEHPHDAVLQLAVSLADDDLGQRHLALFGPEDDLADRSVDVPVAAEDRVQIHGELLRHLLPLRFVCCHEHEPPTCTVRFAATVTARNQPDHGAARYCAQIE